MIIAMFLGRYHQLVNTEIRLITFFVAEDWEALYSQQKKKKRLGADCGSDHHLVIAKIRLKLQKVGKTTRPFRYDLNQIPYDYTVEVMNRFNVLDLVDRVCKELWTDIHNIGGSEQNHPKEKEIQEDKVVIWGGFKNSWAKKGVGVGVA